MLRKALFLKQTGKMYAMFRNEKTRRWLWVVGWTFLIYATLYIVRPICEFLRQRVPLDLVVNGLFIGLALVMLYWVFARLRIGWRRRSLFFLLLFLYAGALTVIEIPEERIHLIEYGILAILIFRALCLDISEFKALGAAFALTTLLGWGDEGIQYLLPNRYYQTQDVLLNSFSGLMGLMLFYSLKGKFFHR
jgi:hypothetical protein